MPKRLLLAFLTSLLVIHLAFQAAVSTQAQDGRFRPTAREIYYIGRTVRGPEVLWTWPGSGLRVAYRNSAQVQLHLAAPTVADTGSEGFARYLWYRVDGGQWKTLLLPPDSDRLFALSVPQDRGLHTLEVMKASEGRVVFRGLTLEPNGVLERPVRPSRRIEVVGDSISVGYRIYGSGGHDMPFDHDARASYGWLVGDVLDAEVRLIGVAGRGVVHDYGTLPEHSITMPGYYGYVHRETTTTNDWSWQPDVIIINLGTNDMTEPAPTPSNVFYKAYARFLGTLRRRNPNALILAMRPFGLFNSAMPVYPEEIRMAVESQRASGDARTLFVDTTGWLTEGDYTDGVHPNAQGNAKAAALLIPIIQSLMGW